MWLFPRENEDLAELRLLFDRWLQRVSVFDCQKKSQREKNGSFLDMVAEFCFLFLPKKWDPSTKIWGTYTANCEKLNWNFLENYFNSRIWKLFVREVRSGEGWGFWSWFADFHCQSHSGISEKWADAERDLTSAWWRRVLRSRMILIEAGEVLVRLWLLVVSTLSLIWGIIFFLFRSESWARSHRSTHIGWIFSTLSRHFAWTSRLLIMSQTERCFAVGV